MVNEYPQVVTIAGSDSDGSAGMQADMNTFLSHKVYGMSVLTACVAGNSYGIHASVGLPQEFIMKQFEVLADDFKIKAAKTGMLGDTATINTVVAAYKKYDFGPLVVDPVIITKHGNMLLEEDAYQTLRTELIPLATVLTPNYYEAQKLAEMQLNSKSDIESAAKKLQKMGAKNIMIKGKHEPGQTDVFDYVLLENGKDFWLEHPYHQTTHFNGTGDTLSAAIAAHLSTGKSMEDAIKLAQKYTYEALVNEIEVGHKFGPINHFI